MGNILFGGELFYLTAFEDAFEYCGSMSCEKLPPNASALAKQREFATRSATNIHHDM